MKLPIHAWTCALLALALAAAPTAAQRPPPSTIQLLRSAAGAGIEANRMENAGRFADALDGYTSTINFTDRALDDFGSYGIPFQARPSIAYWLAARSHFDAARMQLQLGRSRTEVDHHLTRARQAMDAVMMLDSIQARRGGEQYTTDTWKYGFLRGQIQLLRGDLPGARRDYERVTRLNPAFPPAREALSFISYAQGSRVRGTTGEGHELPPKPASTLSLAQLVDLGFEFLALIYKEHAAEIGFAQRLTQMAVQ